MMTPYETAKRAGQADYEDAQDAGLTDQDRWGEGIPHHPESVRLMAFLAEHDLEDYGDHFCWKYGGDGDNGETLMYEMDAYFELRDTQKRPSKKRGLNEWLIGMLLGFIVISFILLIVSKFR